MFRSKIERFFREVEVKTFKHIKGVTASEKTTDKSIAAVFQDS